MRPEQQIDVSIVIPVYGSELVLRELFSQLRAVFEARQWTFEVIFVCDRSPDNSWKVIREMADANCNVRGILLRVNAGQHNALMAGVHETRGRTIVTMDDDLQHSPLDVPFLVQQVLDGSDVVYGRFKTRKHPAWKRIGSKLNNLVASYLIKKPTDLYLSPFRAINSDIRQDVLSYNGPYVYFDGLLLAATRNISSIEVEHHGRYAGESSYGFGKSVSLWLKMATNFSIFPLRLTSLMGMIFSFLGFFLAFCFIVLKFTFNSMPVGWSSLIVTILIVGGIQMLALGMIGEYLGRVLLTLNGRHQYVVEKRIGFLDVEGK